MRKGSAKESLDQIKKAVFLFKTQYIKLSTSILTNKIYNYKVLKSGSKKKFGETRFQLEYLIDEKNTRNSMITQLIFSYDFNHS